MFKKYLISLCSILFLVSCVTTAQEAETDVVNKDGYQMESIDSIEDAEAPKFICFPTEAVISSIMSDGMDKVIVKGIDTSGNLVRIFKSDDDRWVLAVTMPAINMTCPISSGPYMETTKEPSQI
tara:strand:+ start:582 stop:953 length:372 start_codon:yes stop_codon:yes gene_type:complete